jgi:hypothetical protein
MCFLSDALKLDAINIPMLEFIAISKKDSVSVVFEHIEDGTLNLYEIQALKEFVNLNWER